MNKYAPKNIDKDEAQQKYNNGMSLRKLAEHYGCTVKTIGRLGLKTRSQYEASKNFERTFTEDGLKRLSDAAKRRGLGGYRPHPNRGMCYNGIWFDSSWEVTVAKELDANNIKWNRPTVGFIWNDEGRKYYPDFYLPDYNVYLDPKNPYLQIQDKQKLEAAQKRNNIRVLMLNESQLEWKEIQALIV